MSTRSSDLQRAFGVLLAADLSQLIVSQF